MERAYDDISTDNKISPKIPDPRGNQKYFRVASGDGPQGKGLPSLRTLSIQGEEALVRHRPYLQNAEGRLVRSPMKFELVINLKTSKQIGLPIPPEVLAAANRLLK